MTDCLLVMNHAVYNCSAVIINIINYCSLTLLTTCHLKENKITKELPQTLHDIILE